MRKNQIDVIIPTYRPDERVVLLVRRLLKQSRRPDHIYLVNTVSESFPKELTEFPDEVIVTHIRPEQFDHGGTRHEAAMRSKAEFLLYMTQDAVPVGEDLIETLYRCFEDEKVGAAYARQLPAPDCHLIERYTRSFNYPPESCVKSAENLPEMGIKTYFCSDVCAMYRRSIYESLGGFEEKMIFNEDMVMAAKIIQSGYKVAYAAEAKVIHSHNYSCMQQFKRNFDLAVSQTDFPQIFEEVKSENEGIRLVKETARYLIRIRKPWLIFSLVTKSGFKFLGYRLGKQYKKLPSQVILRCTMNRRYWENNS